jgi:hypothetical protein
MAAAAEDPLDLKEGKKPHGKEKFWRELFSGELFEIGFKLRPDHIRDTVSAAKDLGTGVRDIWEDLRKKVTDVLHLPQVERVFDPMAREKTTEIIMTVARGLGYTAAGVQGLGGIYKLVDGHKKGNTGQTLEGLFDLATAGAVASTIAGLGIVPLIMGPVAATMGTVRGAYNAVAGFKKGDGRQEIQGLLDGTRNTSVFLRLLGQRVAGLGLAGMVLGPIAGAIQLSRGYYDLSSGLAEKSKPKQVQGLTDIATAVGLTASLTGVGTIPGIALMAVAMGSRVLYQFNHKFEKWANKKLDDWAPGLNRATEKVEKWVEPALQKIRPIFEKLTGWHRGQDMGQRGQDIGQRGQDMGQRGQGENMAQPSPAPPPPAGAAAEGAIMASYKGW